MKLDKIFHTQSFGKCSSIMESIKFLDKNTSNVRIIRGENDLIKYLKNNTDNRVVYDIANRWYLVGDIELYIHDYLLDYACDAGLYYAKNGRDYKINNEKSLVCFVTHGDENENFRFAEDEYTTQYNYSWINVFDRNGTFKKTPLYKALGKPIYEIDISEEDDDEYLNESVSFELTDDEFVLGGKEFHEESEDIQVFNIYNDTVKIGMLAITEYADNSISLDGLKILPKFRKQGFGKKVVDLLKKKYKGIYVRSIPSAKKFWKKQGHDAYYNNDSGTYDGDLIYEESEFISEAVNEYSLYHGCDLAYAVSMIIENRMRGETVANINGKEVQGNSMTRNYNFAKQWQEERWDGHTDELNQFWVVLELDYNRLKHNHKIVPYNYWEDYFGSEYEHTVDRNGYGNQYEEFVIGTIDNLQLYIKDVYLSDECFYTDYDEIFNIVKEELNLRGERYSDKQIRIALNQLGIQNGYIDREGLNESVIPEQVPEKLYHATFSKLLRKIKKCGYLGNSPYKLWSDSNNKYVYLATDPDEAYSYAETALDDCDNERLYDMLEDDDIVILEIDTKYLDKNKIFRDENVIDGETTYQYEGIINCQIMKIYKPTLNESITYAEKSNYDDSEYQDMTNVILKNPTRKELFDNGMIECRIAKDWNDNFYFANSYEMIHTDIVDKLESENITSVETNLFYDTNSNTFYYNVGHLTDDEIKDFSEREEQMLRTSSYVSKTFKNFKFKLTYGEM